jgi:1-acyl-sn-glycerol-3-phosphate acyltransferase
LVGFVLWTCLIVPPYAVLMGLRVPSRWLARVYWIGTARIIGLKVVVRAGTFSRRRPLLVLSNHMSYLDIVALGALMDAGFVAKSEVGTWPGFGLIARLGRTVFVERKRARAGQGRDDIAQRLREGEPLILFPEGTSSDGNRVLPFKSALLSVAESNPGGRRRRGADQQDAPAKEPPPPRPVIQPVSLAYTRMDGVPIGRAWRPLLAWYGDMDLAPHLYTMAGMGRVTVEVIFHPPVDPADWPSRKTLARHCEQVVAEGVESLLATRPLPSVPPSSQTERPGEPDHAA